MASEKTIRLHTQRAFNGMVRGLASQDWERSNDSVGSCSWRAGGEPGAVDRCCAVGWLVRDQDLGEHKLATWRLGYAFGFAGADMRLPRMIKHVPLKFLLRGQISHDGRGALEERRTRFQELGRAWGLVWPLGVDGEEL